MAFADEAFARKLQFHRPGAAGSRNPVHGHLPVGPRPLDGSGSFSKSGPTFVARWLTAPKRSCGPALAINFTVN